jgi:hypothetical protein
LQSRPKTKNQTEVVVAHYVTNLYQYPDPTYTLADGRVATITSLYTSNRQTPDGMRDCAEGVIDGKKYTIRTDNKPGLVAMLAAEIARREADLLAKVPGIQELLAARAARSDYHEAMQDMMDDESGVRPPKAPAVSAEAVAAQYPEAVAYLRIIAYADADSASNVGYNRRRAADAGIEALNSGSTPTEAKKIMDAAFEAAEKNSTYND